MYILIAILIFGILIAVHEFGHFITAKLCGVRVLEFSIGMGPLLLKRQGKETLYSLRLLPIGGFCAMEEDEASADPRAFPNQNLLKKFLILAAGAGMNFLLGFLIILIVLSGSIGHTMEITAFMEDCPYESETAFHVGDVIWKVDGHRIHDTFDISKYLGGESEVHDITVKRDGTFVTLEDFPIKPIQYPGQTNKMFGFTFSARPETMFERLDYSWNQSVYFVKLVWMSLRDLFSGAYGVQDLSGVVGIVNLISDEGQTVAREAGIYAAFVSISNIAAFISINLAVMNLLPIPALDGGRIFFMLVLWPVEKLFKRRLDPKYEGYVHTAGLILLMGLMAYVAFNDVIRIVS